MENLKLTIITGLFIISCLVGTKQLSAQTVWLDELDLNAATQGFCDMEKLDDFTLNLLTNDEVIEINQDPLVKQATCLQTIGELRIFVKNLEDGDRAVGFCNFGIDKVDISYKDFDKIVLNGKFNIRDLWRQNDISPLETKTGELILNEPAHGVVLYKFSSVK